jgi:hypothetical protein
LICVAPSGGGGGGGGGGGPTPTPEISAAEITWFKTSGGAYSYDKDDDTCTQRVDPIGMVIRRTGVETADHVAHHPPEEGQAVEPLNSNVVEEGLPWDNEGRQRFLDTMVSPPLPLPPACVWGEVSQAHTDGWNWCGQFGNLYHCAASRWHVRCNVVESEADPDGGTWSVCTPHWDQEDGDNPCWHWVPAVFGDRWDGGPDIGIEEDISGFTAGVDYLYTVLVTEGGHRFMGSYWYGNDEVMHQCVPDDPQRFEGDPGDWTGGDGWVNFIEVLP